MILSKQPPGDAKWTIASRQYYGPHPYGWTCHVITEVVEHDEECAPLLRQFIQVWDLKLYIFYFVTTMKIVYNYTFL